MNKLVVLGVLLAAVAVAYYFGQQSATPVPASEPTAVAVPEQASTSQPAAEAPPEVPTTTLTEVTTVAPAEARPAVQPPQEASDRALESFTIDLSTLDPGQQQLLSIVGIEGDTLTITRPMIDCAETELGKERMDALLSGEKPGFTEGLTLFDCYQNN